MNTTGERLPSLIGRSLEQGMGVMDKIFAAAQPGAVYGEPVTSGNYTVITASEVTAAGGFGSGAGFGPGAASTAQKPAEGAASEGQPQEAGGGGMGGGGTSFARPVAVVTIGPDGVRVKPVVDVTKLGLALLTAWGAMWLTLARMRKVSKA